MRSKLLKRISLLIVLVISLSGCSKKYSVEEYNQDALFLNEAMTDVETQFADALEIYDKNGCKKWIDESRKNMVDNTITDLGADVVNSAFDMYEFTYDFMVKNNSLGNTDLMYNHLEELNDNSKMRKLNSKHQEAIIALKISAGY